MRRTFLLAIALAACGHSEPFVGTSGRADGPLNADGQLTVGAYGDFDWAGDGSGVLLLMPRPNESYDLPLLVGVGRKDPLDNCLGLIPAAGGSMIWQLCDRTLTHYRDSNDVFVSAAVGGMGELLYMQTHQRPGFFFPVGTEAELWLGSRHAPYAQRRHLLRLYRDDNGHPTVTPDQINWLTDLQWAGSGAFIARAYYLRPDSLLTPFGITHGVISRDTTLLTIIPGTAAIGRFASAEGGSTIVYDKPGNVIVALPVAGGPERIVDTLPFAPSRAVVSLSCQQELCLVVTREAGGGSVASSNIWRISLATGQASILQTFIGRAVPEVARLSPDRTRVVVRKTDGRLYLLADLLN
ncbi:MAG: hypothetical protein V4558_15680 [Gemmatimonadota bacterium]